MAITRWHWGKLVILWVWGLLVMGLCYSGLTTIDREKYVAGFMLIGVLFAVPLLLSRLTWIWLGGKETHGTGSRAPGPKTDEKERSEPAGSD